MRESLRLFVALELPVHFKEALEDIIGQVKGRGLTSVRWVDTEGIHLTLKFLGNVPSERLQEIVSGLEAPLLDATPFTLALDRLGAFPNLKRPRVLWVGISGEMDALLALQQRVEACLEPLGFPREERRFSPHLTLARLGDSTDHRLAGEALSAASMPQTGPMAVDGVSLMKSTLLPSGAVHQRLAFFPLRSR